METKVKCFSNVLDSVHEVEIAIFLRENPKIKVISSSTSCIEKKCNFTEYFTLIIYEEDE